MKLALFLLCALACLVAHLALAFVSLRERCFWPMAYAALCAVFCGVTIVGVAAPEFVRDFATAVVPAFAAAWALYLLVFLARVQSGASATEMLLGAALICGCGASIAAGALAPPGYFRLAVQTAVVIVPIAIAIASLGPKPLEQPVSQAIYSPVLASPMPEVGQ